MGLKNIEECERTKIERWSQFQLPNNWKRIGTTICILAILTAIALRFSDINSELFKDTFRKVLLVGLLIISLSKEKIEDEMIVSLRAKSYTLAFIFAVGFALVHPLLEYLLHNFVIKASPENGFSYFEMLSFMLMVQIMFFVMLKRNR